jgi:hypothetical protein
MRVRASPIGCVTRLAQPTDPRSPATARIPAWLPTIRTISALVRHRHARSARRAATSWELRTVEMSDAELAALARRPLRGPEDIRWSLVLSADGGRRL